VGTAPNPNRRALCQNVAVGAGFLVRYPAWYVPSFPRKPVPRHPPAADHPATARKAFALRVPGSASNVGAGFDSVGIAVPRWLVARVLDEQGARAPWRVERQGTLAGLDLSAEEDKVVRGFEAACRHAGCALPPALTFVVSSDIPIARGLGSSAAAFVAGIALADLLLRLRLDRGAMVEIGTALEGHPDNIAPIVYGGATLALREADRVLVVPLTVHPTLTLVFLIPDFPVETAHAREVLPSTVSHATAVRAAARSAALVQGLATGHGELLRAALADELHVPFRRHLVRGYDDVVAAAVGSGAYGATLSGSGSTILALTAPERAEGVASSMGVAWSRHGVRSEALIASGRVPGVAEVGDAAG